MRIGIDIDDTLTDTKASIDKVIKKYNINLKKRYNNKFTMEDINFIFSNY